ncbi:MAG: alpha/beta hydrolase [candidate division KSB1 bacterium]|nr:alpha/beta hydrolase [candidate division KSB1 bacterium]MDZ7275814.1 alpha/beta hydrolase [candidate division KSB1 bacterium]MDZ7287565.1 alpha/beta hydrolase [candidate division KSB1 bacterium]MDZ7308031.1 alpha/beta hydrolase [candidate division KSB1 bacterium]MDZ7350543.1 alpha/beta hydrolase [candidate division KSB1 bacterium]
MKPFYFGTPEKPLFGVFHPSPQNLHRKLGVVICNPIGQEHIRAHRALRLLATRLNQAGFHVLRFDYYGCGDSAGESEEGTLEQWREDVAHAVTELKKHARVNQVALLGLRLGASLSLLAGSQREDVTSLILWEPVVSGAQYLQRLLKDHEQWGIDAGLKSKPANGNLEVLGFPLPASLRHSLTRLNLLALSSLLAKRIFLVVNEEKPGDLELRNHLAQFASAIDYQQISGLKVWAKQAGADKGMVPAQILHTLVAWLSRLDS